MNKIKLSLAALALAAAPAGLAAPFALKAPQQSPTLAMAKRLHASASAPHAWAKGDNGSASLRIVRDDPDGQLEPSSMYGNLFTPDGENWLYTADLTTDANGSISSVKTTVYNANLKKYSSFSFDLSVGEGETAINYVEIAPQLTKKFFNFDESYEVMVYVHATTPDFEGHDYTKVFSLSDGKHIADIEGLCIASLNTATDPWSENYTVIFMRDRLVTTVIDDSDPENPIEETDYSMLFDVYKKASWGEPTATLAHTFEVDYELFSGAGERALPILLAKNGNKLSYALPHYEKPFFTNNNFLEEPEATPDNNFVIDIYADDFTLASTTKVPMTTKEGYLFTFPGLGLLQGFDDFSYTMPGTSGPAFIVGYENYETISDGFICDFEVYDVAGQKLGDIYHGAEDYMWLSDVDGFDSQYCFYSQGKFEMVDVPSGHLACSVPTDTGNGNSLTFSLDRVAKGSGYCYVSSMAFAETDKDDNALHQIAWIGTDGKIDHVDAVNLGSDVALAQVNIDASALQPYLFNTDSDYEYMFLVKVLENPESPKTNEFLRIYGQSGNKLLDMGPGPDGILRSIFIFNGKRLAVMYDDYEQCTIKYFDLPLMKFAGGDGSAANPYVLATPGDVMAIASEPSACYVLGKDINFGSYPWSGNACEFTGTLVGNGHKLEWLNIHGPGIFASVNGTAKITDLIINNSSLSNSDGEGCGFIAGSAFGTGENSHPVISNVRVYNASIAGEDGPFGSIVGVAGLYTEISGCSSQYADIALGSNSVAGGIAGRMQTSAAISACYFEGQISAEVAGGIVGEAYTSGGSIENCHVDASIVGESHAAGVIADAQRINIAHCYVQGDVRAAGEDRAFAGGIGASLEPSYEEAPTVIIANNIVALSSLNTNSEARKASAHRIIGFSSADDKLIDWDNVTEGMDPADYPLLPGDPEKGLEHNYAIGIDAIDSSLAADHTSTEGKDLTLAEVTDSWLASQKWAMGSTLAEPWCKGAEGLYLYYEGADGIAGIAAPSIADAAQPAIAFEGGILSAPAPITIYTPAGLPIAHSLDGKALDTASLPSGLYIAVSSGRALKFAKP